jgi:hypothetical protein
MRLRRWYWLVTLFAAGCNGIITGPAAAQGPVCTGTALTSASNVQAAINNTPPDTTFCFGTGTYSVSSLVRQRHFVIFDGTGVNETATA